LKKTFDKLGMALNGYNLKYSNQKGDFDGSQLDENIMLSEDCFSLIK
jgi:hypothetical protein